LSLPFLERVDPVAYGLPGTQLMNWRDTLGRWLGIERKMDPLELFRELYGGRQVKSGVVVNWKTALEVTTALACLRLLSNGVAQVPLKLFREAEGKRQPATDHPLYDILSAQPNDNQTSFEYRETVLLHAGLAGNHYSFINRVDRGRTIAELLPMQPQQMRTESKPDGSLRYFYSTLKGDTQELPRASVWHVRGPSWTSGMGLETVYLLREALGLSIATENAHANLHRGGVQAGGTYSVEGTLTPVQMTQLNAWLDKFKNGGELAGSPMVLDRDAKWLQTGMSGVDAQHLETRKLQIEEVCRGFGVLPIMVGHADKTATYASAEQMFLAHVVHTLAPWYERLEQSINKNLLTAEDRKAGYYAKFVEEGLLRGSLKDTKDMLLGYVNGGVMYPNEARAKLDLNPDADEKSNQLRVPANVVGVDKQPVDDPAPASAGA
jgi:HK97 family phage portal protein